MGEYLVTLMQWLLYIPHYWMFIWSMHSGIGMLHGRRMTGMSVLMLPIPMLDGLNVKEGRAWILMKFICIDGHV